MNIIAIKKKRYMGWKGDNIFLYKGDMTVSVESARKFVILRSIPDSE